MFRKGRNRDVPVSLPNERKALAERYTIDAEEADARSQRAAEDQGTGQTEEQVATLRATEIEARREAEMRAAAERAAEEQAAAQRAAVEQAAAERAAEEQAAARRAAEERAAADRAAEEQAAAQRAAEEQAAARRTAEEQAAAQRAAEERAAAQRAAEEQAAARRAAEERAAARRAAEERARREAEELAAAQRAAEAEAKRAAIVVPIRPETETEADGRAALAHLQTTEPEAPAGEESAPPLAAVSDQPEEDSAADLPLYGWLQQVSPATPDAADWTRELVRAKEARSAETRKA